MCLELTTAELALSRRDLIGLEEVAAASAWEGLQAAIEEVRRQVMRGEGERRAIQLQFPQRLIDALGNAARRSGRKKTSLLVEAAREYRARHPIPPGWVDVATVPTEKPAKRGNTVVTLRFPEEDRELIRNIGRGRPDIADRYAAFLEIADLLDEMHAEDDQQELRRVELPRPIVSSLSAAESETRRTKGRILSSALRRCHQRASSQDHLP